MSYGIQVLNDSSYVQIDSELPRMCKLDSGSYGNGSDYATTNFSRVITTQDPPLIFIRSVSAATASSQLYYSLTLNGSAGNWTGFTIKAGSTQYRPAGDWFCASFASMPTDGYGMRVWDANGKLVYDSGAPPVIVTFAYATWSYAGSVQLDIGARHKWVMNYYLGANEFVLINPFALRSVGAQSTNPAVGLQVDYANSQICMFQTGQGVWTDQGQKAILCAKLVA